MARSPLDDPFPDLSGPAEVGRSTDPLDDPLAELRPLPPASLADRVEDLRDRLRAAPGRALAAALAVLVALGIAWWLLRPPAAPPIESQIPLAGETNPAAGTAPVAPGVTGAPAGASTTTTAVDLVVQAAGAVRSPGVYRLPTGARVDDLVTAAGGLTPDADADRVNLAAPVADGERIWVPRQGETGVPDVVAGSATPPAVGGSGGTSPEGDATPTVIDLNAASPTELEELPGVGPATAAAIVAHREQNGPFGSVDELLDVRGIGEAKLEQIRPMATVG